MHPAGSWRATGSTSSNWTRTATNRACGRVGQGDAGGVADRRTGRFFALWQLFVSERDAATLNEALTGDIPLGKYVTMIYAVLDARSREITVASAGHLRPLLINGTCSFLDIDTGLPLGLGASSYPEHQDSDEARHAITALYRRHHRG